MDSPFKILFVSRHNSVRAPLAVALTKKIAGQKVHALSAGAEVGQAPEMVVEFITKLTGEAVPEWQALNDVADQNFDLIITLCDKSHAAIAEHPHDTLHVRWDMHHPESVEQLKHLEIELAERLHLMLQARHLV